MSLFYAVAFVNHQAAQVLQFSLDETVERKVHARRHFTPQYNSKVRTEHEFFGKVCDAVDGIAEVLITGEHTGLTDFRHCVEKHRPPTAARIVDHPTKNHLAALARKHLAKYDQMGDTCAT